MKKKVVAALSGGVDSSTAAALLVEQGYEVIGMTLKIPYACSASRELGKEYSGCCGTKGIEDARAVAQKLGIPHYVVDCEKEFSREVIDYLCREYLDGRTPNPCAVCNRKIKFGLLLDKAVNIGAEFIATGHYSRLLYNEKIDRYIMKKGKDVNKDQSYFLFLLEQNQLKHILFPLASMTKTEVRKKAELAGLPVFDKPGSQEICFIPDDDYHRYLEERVSAGGFAPGNIVDVSGAVVGRHKGIAFYTIGQRKGIGSFSLPYYVLSIDKKTNSITVGEEQKLYRDSLTAAGVNWISIDTPWEPLKVKARIRYKSPDSDAMVYPLDGDRVKLAFERPQRAVAPGQAVVFYDGDTLLGGAWIE